MGRVLEWATALPRLTYSADSQAAEDDFGLDWPDERDLTEDEEALVIADAEKATHVHHSGREVTAVRLQVAGVVKLVAVDCDLTLLGIHTGGG